MSQRNDKSNSSKGTTNSSQKKRTKTCQTCSNVFISISSYYRHIRRIHPIISFTEEIKERVNTNDKQSEFKNEQIVDNARRRCTNSV